MNIPYPYDVVYTVAMVALYLAAFLLIQRWR
jgi:hypothetical protein